MTAAPGRGVHPPREFAPSPAPVALIRFRRASQEGARAPASPASVRLAGRKNDEGDIGCAASAQHKMHEAIHDPD